MRQARFWIDHKGGVVRLKIRAGDTLCFSHGGATDEGYSWTGESYAFDGQRVTCQWATDSRDCDGRMTHNGEAFCHVARLSSGYTDPDCGVAFPAWEHGEQSQRDHTAESMNY